MLSQTDRLSGLEIAERLRLEILDHGQGIPDAWLEDPRVDARTQIALAGAEDRITWEERVYLQWYPESPVVVTK